jgi:hypothetical protein
MFENTLEERNSLRNRIVRKYIKLVAILSLCNVFFIDMAVAQDCRNLTIYWMPEGLNHIKKWQQDISYSIYTDDGVKQEPSENFDTLVKAEVARMTGNIGVKVNYIEYNSYYRGFNVIIYVTSDLKSSMLRHVDDLKAFFDPVAPNLQLTSNTVSSVAPFLRGCGAMTLGDAQTGYRTAALFVEKDKNAFCVDKAVAQMLGLRVDNVDAVNAEKLVLSIGQLYDKRIKSGMKFSELSPIISDMCGSD